MNSSAVDTSRKEKAVANKSPHRSPLAQMVHALNQPLTGLQCSMEVALARPRTVEQHVFGLHEALVLTERMRALVEAIREVADMEEADIAAGEEHSGALETGALETRALETGALETGALETGALESILREAVEDLRPVAEEKNVRIALDCSAALSAFSPGVTTLNCLGGQVIFRLLDSAVSLAVPGTVVRMEAGAEEKVWLRLQWQADAPRSECSRPELGLLIAQAGLERCGAQWQREEIDGLTVLQVGWARPRLQVKSTGSQE
jgi:signal transduction histidine kinase